MSEFLGFVLIGMVGVEWGWVVSKPNTFSVCELGLICAMFAICYEVHQQCSGKKISSLKVLDNSLLLSSSLGKRDPFCGPGCYHRNDLNSRVISVQGFQRRCRAVPRSGSTRGEGR